MPSPRRSQPRPTSMSVVWGFKGVCLKNETHDGTESMGIDDLVSWDFGSMPYGECELGACLITGVLFFSSKGSDALLVRFD